MPDCSSATNGKLRSRGEEPDLSLARATALEPLVSDKLRQQLKPLFETRVRRTDYSIADDTRSVALTIDQGMIDAGDRSRPLCEIELELKRGKIVEVFDALERLQDGLGDLNDIAVDGERIREMSLRCRSNLNRVFAAGLLTREEAQIGAAMAVARKAYAEVA
jgi:hypothetical protein